MAKRLLVIGSTCVDVVIRVDHLPKTEENLHPQGQTFCMGGCAYNVANLLGRAGRELTFVTPVGEKGLFGPFVKNELAQQPWAKVILLSDRENGCCYCLVEPSGERTFMSIHGAEYSFAPSWMTPFLDTTYDYGYVCGLEIEEENGEELAAFMQTAPVKQWLYAPGPRCMRIPPARHERIFSAHPILHLNRAEALALGASQNLQTAAEHLFERTQRAVITTLGAEGACVYDGTRMQEVPAAEVTQVADTIGAGDAHAAGVLLGLSHDLSFPKAIALANQASAYVVQTRGATLPDNLITKVIRVLDDALQP